MFKLRIKENEKDLRCGQQHQSPILMVNLNPNLQSNKRLLCEKCLYLFESDCKMIGLKKIIQIIEENKKESFYFSENLLTINIDKVQSIKSQIQKLRSYLVQQLDQLLQDAEEWTIKIQSIRQKFSEFSFFQELDYIIINQKSYIEDQANLQNQIKILNDTWNKKISSKLETFKSFNEIQVCKEILNILSEQSTQKQTIEQSHNQNIQNIPNFIDWQVFFNGNFTILPKQYLNLASTNLKEQQEQQQPKKGGLFGFINKS